MSEELVVIQGMIEWPEALHDEMQAVLVELVERTHQDEGCVEYRWAADLGQRGRFWFFEAWASPATYELHRSATYEAVFMERHASRAVAARGRQYACSGFADLASEL